MKIFALLVFVIINGSFVVYAFGRDPIGMVLGIPSRKAYGLLAFSVFAVTATALMWVLSK